MDRCDGLCRLASVAEEVSQSQERSHSERFDGRYLPLNHIYIYNLYVFRAIIIFRFHLARSRQNSNLSN